MPHQSAVTVRAPLRDGARPQVEEVLEDLRREGPDDDRLPLRRLTGVHFARVFVLDGATDADGTVLPDCLYYMADVDGDVHRHLVELVARASTSLDVVLGGCEGYPVGGGREDRLGWLEAHLERPAAYYVHTVGRTVSQVLGERRLRDELGVLLDDRALTADAPPPLVLRRRLLTAVRDRSDLAWALRPAAGPGALHRVREALHAVAVPLVVLPLLPLLLPVVAGALLLLRRAERRDPVEHGPADRAHVDRVEAYEDHGAQNPFTAAGFVKAGTLRRTTMRVALAGLDYAVRHAFARDHLAGVRTIHFARWLPVDGGRRVLFASSYDGSQESYMDDFIDRLHWGVNLVFSNGVGYPRTRWLVAGGARDEVTYKQYLRRHQVPTVVFFSAYADLTARAADDGTRARAGCARALDEPAARQWLARL